MFTNFACFGQARFAVVDAGAHQEQERQALREYIRARMAQGHTLSALLLTHHHPDHAGAMDDLRSAFKVPLYAHRACEARLDFAVDHYVQEGDRIDLGPQDQISVFETPGHAEGHVVYLHEASGWCYAGDLVIEKGSVLIDKRDGGSVSQYLDSLHRISALCEGSTPRIRALIPGHGNAITQPKARIQELVSHRRHREGQIFATLGQDPIAEDKIIAQIYADKPAHVLPFAKATVRAHLQKLAQEGKAQSCGSGRWQLL